MAQVNASADYPAPAEAVWKVLTDFRRYPEWVAFHKGWRAEPPATVEAGATLQENVVILGPPAVVDWQIVAAQEGELLELTGKGATGVEAKLVYRLLPAGDDTTLSIDLELTGGPVVGPIGDMIQDAAQKLVDQSLRKFPAAG
jgi:uncharacterized protein YndB with AHSA1/START domain